MTDRFQAEKDYFEAGVQTPSRRTLFVMSLIRQLIPELTDASRSKANEAIKLLVELSNGEVQVSEHTINLVEMSQYIPGNPRLGAIRLMYERYAFPQEIHPTLASNPKVLATFEAVRFADYVLNRQDELAETLKRLEAEEAERDRAWKDHQA